MFALRIVKVDYYLSAPKRGLDECYSEFRGRQLSKVPVVRIFGSTPAGQKTCLHLHGAYPYVCVPYDGSLPADRYMYQLAVSLDHGLSSNQSHDTGVEHVLKVELVSGLPFYGFHAREQQFLKIYFLNPHVIDRAVDLLQNGQIMNRSFQPFEAHIPFLLQMFIDNNLHGMNLIRLKTVKFRHDETSESVSRLASEKGSDASSGSGSLFSCFPGSSESVNLSGHIWDPGTLPRQYLAERDVMKVSSCELEVDAVLKDILNAQEMSGLQMNPGIATIWEEERQRRRDANESSQLTPLASQDRAGYVGTKSEQLYLDVLREKLSAFRSANGEPTLADVSQAHEKSGIELVVEKGRRFPGGNDSLCEKGTNSSSWSGSPLLSQVSLNEDDREVLDLLMDLAETGSTASEDSDGGGRRLLPPCVKDADEADQEDSVTMSQVVWDADSDAEHTKSDDSDNDSGFLRSPDDPVIMQVDGATDRLDIPGSSRSLQLRGDQGTPSVNVLLTTKTTSSGNGRLPVQNRIASEPYATTLAVISDGPDRRASGKCSDVRNSSLQKDDPGAGSGAAAAPVLKKCYVALERTAVLSTCTATGENGSGRQDGRSRSHGKPAGSASCRSPDGVGGLVLATRHPDVPGAGKSFGDHVRETCRNCRSPGRATRSKSPCMACEDPRRRRYAVVACHKMEYCSSRNTGISNSPAPRAQTEIHVPSSSSSSSSRSGSNCGDGAVSSRLRATASLDAAKSDSAARGLPARAVRRDTSSSRSGGSVTSGVSEHGSDGDSSDGFVYTIAERVKRSSMKKSPPAAPSDREWESKEEDRSLLKPSTRLLKRYREECSNSAGTSCSDVQSMWVVSSMAMLSDNGCSSSSNDTLNVRIGGEIRTMCDRAKSKSDLAVGSVCSSRSPTLNTTNSNERVTAPSSAKKGNLILEGADFPEVPFAGKKASVNARESKTAADGSTGIVTASSDFATRSPIMRQSLDRVLLVNLEDLNGRTSASVPPSCAVLEATASSSVNSSCVSSTSSGVPECRSARGSEIVASVERFQKPVCDNAVVASSNTVSRSTDSESASKRVLVEEPLSKSPFIRVKSSVDVWPSRMADEIGDFSDDICSTVCFSDGNSGPSLDDSDVDGTLSSGGSFKKVPCLSGLSKALNHHRQEVAVAEKDNVVVPTSVPAVSEQGNVKAKESLMSLRNYRKKRLCLRYQREQELENRQMEQKLKNLQMEQKLKNSQMEQPPQNLQMEQLPQNSQMEQCCAVSPPPSVDISIKCSNSIGCSLEPNRIPSICVRGQVVSVYSSTISVEQLRQIGRETVVVDRLSSCWNADVTEREFRDGDVADRVRVENVPEDGFCDEKAGSGVGPPDSCTHRTSVSAVDIIPVPEVAPPSGTTLVRATENRADTPRPTPLLSALEITPPRDPSGAEKRRLIQKLYGRGATKLSRGPVEGVHKLASAIGVSEPTALSTVDQPVDCCLIAGADLDAVGTDRIGSECNLEPSDSFVREAPGAPSVLTGSAAAVPEMPAPSDESRVPCSTGGRVPSAESSAEEGEVQKLQRSDSHRRPLSWNSRRDRLKRRKDAPLAERQSWDLVVVEEDEENSAVAPRDTAMAASSVAATVAPAVTAAGSATIDHSTVACPKELRLSALDPVVVLKRLDGRTIALHTNPPERKLSILKFRLKKRVVPASDVQGPSGTRLTVPKLRIKKNRDHFEILRSVPEKPRIPKPLLTSEYPSVHSAPPDVESCHSSPGYVPPSDVCHSVPPLWLCSPVDDNQFTTISREWLYGSSDIRQPGSCSEDDDEHDSRGLSKFSDVKTLTSPADSWSEQYCSPLSAFNDDSNGPRSNECVRPSQEDDEKDVPSTGRDATSFVTDDKEDVMWNLSFLSPMASVSGHGVASPPRCSSPTAGAPSGSSDSSDSDIEDAEAPYREDQRLHVSDTVDALKAFRFRSWTSSQVPVGRYEQSSHRRHESIRDPIPRIFVGPQVAYSPADCCATAVVSETPEEMPGSLQSVQEPTPSTSGPLAGDDNDVPPCATGCLPSMPVLTGFQIDSHATAADSVNRPVQRSAPAVRSEESADFLFLGGEDEDEETWKRVLGLPSTKDVAATGRACRGSDASASDSSPAIFVASCDGVANDFDAHRFPGFDCSQELEVSSYPEPGQVAYGEWAGSYPSSSVAGTACAVDFVRSSVSDQSQPLPASCCYLPSLYSQVTCGMPEASPHDVIGDRSSDDAFHSKPFCCSQSVCKIVDQLADLDVDASIPCAQPEMPPPHIATQHPMSSLTNVPPCPLLVPDTSCSNYVPPMDDYSGGVYSQPEVSSSPMQRFQDCALSSSQCFAVPKDTKMSLACPSQFPHSVVVGVPQPPLSSPYVPVGSPSSSSSSTFYPAFHRSDSLGLEFDTDASVLDVRLSANCGDSLPMPEGLVFDSDIERDLEELKFTLENSMLPPAAAAARASITSYSDISSPECISPEPRRMSSSNFARHARRMMAVSNANDLESSRVHSFYSYDSPAANSSWESTSVWCGERRTGTSPTVAPRQGTPSGGQPCVLQKSHSVKGKVGRHIPSVSMEDSVSGRISRTTTTTTSTSPLSSARSVLTYSVMPPTPDDIQASCSRYSIPNVRHTEAFCSDPRDVPRRPVEFGSGAVVVRLQANDLSAVADFESPLSETGLDHWRQVYLIAKQSGYSLCEDDGAAPPSVPREKKPVLYRGQVWEPCRLPPAPRDIQNWLRTKAEKLHGGGVVVKTEVGRAVSSAGVLGDPTEVPSQVAKSGARFLGSIFRSGVSPIMPPVRDPSGTPDIVHSTPDRVRDVLKCRGQKRALLPAFNEAVNVAPTEEAPESQSSVVVTRSMPSASLPGNIAEGQQHVCGRSSVERPGNDRDNPSVTPVSKRRKLAVSQSPSAENVSLRKRILAQNAKLHSPVLEKAQTSQLEGPSPKNTYGFKISNDSLLESSYVHQFQFLTTMSLELHVETTNDLRPDPNHNSIRAIFYHVHHDVPDGHAKWGERATAGVIVATCRPPCTPTNSDGGGLSKSGDHCAAAVEESIPGVLKNCEMLGDVRLKNVADEVALIKEFVAVVLKHDPDLLVGYEIQMSSWGFLMERAENLGMKLTSELSRVADDSLNSFRPVQSSGDGFVLNIVGRIIVSVWQLMRHELSLYNYNFENVAYHVLHKRIPLFTFRTLSRWFDGGGGGGTQVQRWRTIQHYVIRAVGNFQLLERLNVVGRTSELARLFGIQFTEVHTRGTQFRVESMMLRMCRQAKYVAVSPSVQQRAAMRAPECLPLIMEPVSRFYTHPVVVLDFQSLYPSIIIAYNYCFSTCLGRVEHLADAIDAFHFGCTSLRMPPGLLLNLEDRVNVSPCGVAFVRSGVRKGILPRMLEEILTTRVMVKKAMKRYRDDKALHRMLDARQLGLKLIANVTYGYTSANFSGRMPCIEVADSVVSKARETLERAIQLIESTPKWGGRVVYGDTDSIFVLLEGRSKEQAFAIGQEIVDAVTAANPKPVKLKMEKVYLPCVLQTKKRYVGFMYETLDQTDPVYDAKGIETVRRDGCPAVAKILEKSLRILFSTRDVSQVRAYVTHQFQKLLTGRASLQEAIFTREYRGRFSYILETHAPALKIARQCLRTDPRSEPRVQERVPYVIVYGSPGSLLIDLVRHPNDVLLNPTLRLNAKYYIGNVIVPPLDRVLSLLGADVRQWYATMSRCARSRFPHDVHAQEKGTISQYFVSSSCPVCDGPLAACGVCDTCAGDPQLVAVVLGERIRESERRYMQISMVCYNCVGAPDPQMGCVSLDCPNLFRLVQTSRDVSQVSTLRGLLKGDSLQW